MSGPVRSPKKKIDDDTAEEDEDVDDAVSATIGDYNDQKCQRTRGNDIVHPPDHLRPVKIAF